MQHADADRDKAFALARSFSQRLPTTLEELASQYGVSRERVRQIEVRAFEKLQKAMRSAAEDTEVVVRTEVPQEQAQSSRSYQATKTHIHQVLLERIDLEAMENLAPERLKEELRQMVERLLLEENLVLNAGERRNLVRDIQYEMLGYGPLEPLLADSRKLCVRTSAGWRLTHMDEFVDELLIGVRCVGHVVSPPVAENSRYFSCCVTGS